jgi:hypothetical protein
MSHQKPAAELSVGQRSQTVAVVLDKVFIDGPLDAGDGFCESQRSVGKPYQFQASADVFAEFGPPFGAVRVAVHPFEISPVHPIRHSRLSRLWSATHSASHRHQEHRVLGALRFSKSTRMRYHAAADIACVHETKFTA